MLIIVAFLIVLIFINAFFSSSEIAIISFRETKLKPLVQKDIKSAKVILEYHKQPSNFLSDIQVGVTLAGFFISAIAATYLGPAFAELILPITGNLSEGISVFLVTLLLSYITLVFAEVLPKHLAILNPEPIALFFARPLKFISYIIAPLSIIVSFSTNSIIKLLGYEPELSKKTITEEELQLLVAEQQDLKPEEKELIQEAIEIGEVTVRQIMIPRNDIIAMPITGNIDDALMVSSKAGHTRIPIFEENLDNIIGMVHIKDAISKLRSDQEKQQVTQILRPVLYIPETNKVLLALRQLQKSGLHLAVALDEYGGTAGIVTIEDIIEEIVGEIRDEYDIELDLIKPAGKNTFLVEGKVPIEELNDSIKTEIPSSPDYDTVAGWLIDKFNRIPKQGESLEFKNYVFTVNKMKKNRIVAVLIKSI